MSNEAFGMYIKSLAFDLKELADVLIELNNAIDGKSLNIEDGFAHFERRVEYLRHLVHKNKAYLQKQSYWNKRKAPSEKT